MTSISNASFIYTPYLFSDNDKPRYIIGEPNLFHSPGCKADPQPCPPWPSFPCSARCALRACGSSSCGRTSRCGSQTLRPRIPTRSHAGLGTSSFAPASTSYSPRYCSEVSTNAESCWMNSSAFSSDCLRQLPMPWGHSAWTASTTCNGAKTLIKVVILFRTNTLPPSHRPPSLATSSASLRRLSARCCPAGPPRKAAARPNFDKMIDNLTGCTGAYDMLRIEGWM
jgi:hypothetical protein